MAVQPAGTSFEEDVTVVKNLADAFLPMSKLSEEMQSVNSVSGPAKKCI